MVSKLLSILSFSYLIFLCGLASLELQERNLYWLEYLRIVLISGWIKPLLQSCVKDKAFRNRSEQIVQSLYLFHCRRSWAQKPLCYITPFLRDNQLASDQRSFLFYGLDAMYQTWKTDQVPKVIMNKVELQNFFLRNRLH